MDKSNSTFSAHSIEKIDAFNAPIYSGNVYSENKCRDLNTPPHNPDQFNAENLGSNQHEKLVLAIKQIQRTQLELLQLIF